MEAFMLYPPLNTLNITGPEGLQPANYRLQRTSNAAWAVTKLNKNVNKKGTEVFVL